MRLTMRQVKEGEMIPFGYGIAYYEYAWNSAVCYPIPFNFIARWVRRILFQLKNPGPDGLDKKYNEGYSAGHDKGFNRGFEAGRQHEIQIQIQSINRLIGEDDGLVQNQTMYNVSGEGSPDSGSIGANPPPEKPAGA